MIKCFKNKSDGIT